MINRSKIAEIIVEAMADPTIKTHRTALALKAAEKIIELFQPTATVGAPDEGPVVAVITEVRVPWETIINAFVGVCETSASTYWLSSFQPLEPECSGLVASCREAKEPWYATLDFWGKGGRATLRHDDPNNDDQQTNTIIGETEIISGLNAMANKCPKHFADLVSENDDAITHDVMIQCIVFGEIIYG